MPPQDPEHRNDSASEGVGGESFVVELSPYSITAEGSAANDDMELPLRNSRWMKVAGFAIIGLAAAAPIFLIRSSVDEVTTATTFPVTTLATGGTDGLKAVGPDTTMSTAIAPDAPVVAPLLIGGVWAYTAVKIGDVRTAPGFFVSEPVGASLSGVLVIDEVCEDTRCSYTSRYDLDRTFLEPSEGGQPAPGVWDAEGSVWFVEVAAFVLQSQGDGGCVVRVEETWKVSLADRELGADGWAASAFTGSVLRSTSSEPTLSAAGPGVCGDWHVLDEWSVTGRAVIDSR